MGKIDSIGSVNSQGFLLDWELSSLHAKFIGVHPSNHVCTTWLLCTWPYLIIPDVGT